MVGELAVSFCERNSGHASVCLDLWSYPDGTYNLVVEHLTDEGVRELSFPCSLHQLVGLLDRKPLTSDNEMGSILLERCGESVCAQFECGLDGKVIRHCISIENYRQAIEALQDNVVGYLA